MTGLGFKPAEQSDSLRFWIEENTATARRRVGGAWWHTFEAARSHCLRGLFVVCSDGRSWYVRPDGKTSEVKT